MEFNSQICTTREQSDRLLALGLNTETADMGLIGNILIILPTTWTNADPMFDTPAWSLHRLIKMMPCGFQDEHYRNFVLKIDSQDISYVYNYIDDEGYGQSDSIDVDDIYHNLYDGIIAHIKWLIKKGLFDKEYLEE